MVGIIDFHAHAFPDKVAAGAVPALAAAGNVSPCLDGRIASLLADMDRVGIEKSVLCSIATKPGQFEAILAWSQAIRSERIIPFPSFHPENPNALENIRIIKENGFKGIKMHPYYQNFILDDERMFPLYEQISEAGLILVMHTGFNNRPACIDHVAHIVHVVEIAVPCCARTLHELTLKLQGLN